MTRSYRSITLFASITVALGASACGTADHPNPLPASDGGTGSDGNDFDSTNSADGGTGPDGNDSGNTNPCNAGNDSGSVASGLQPGAPWPMHRHGADHSGRSPASGPNAPQVKWQFAPPGKFYQTYCPPVIGADGTIYLPTDSGTMYAVGADGMQKWAANTPGHCFGSPAIAADGTIYASSASLHALAPDGTERWSFTPKVDEIGGAPAIASDGTVYVAAESEGLHALRPDGTVRWTFATTKRAKSSPAIGSDGTIYVTGDNKLFALSPDGTKKWDATVSDAQNVSPAIGPDGTIYVLNPFGVIAFSPCGTMLWTDDQMTSAQFPPALGTDGTVYAVSNMGDLLVYGAGSKTATKGPHVANSASAPALDARGVLYAAGNDCLAHAIDAQGHEKWSLQVQPQSACSAPVIGSDGTLYFVASGLTAVGD